MARTVTHKSYPLLKWCIAAGIVVGLVGLWQANVFASDPDATPIDTDKLLLFLGGAVVLFFVALLFPRKETYEVTLPTDRLHDASRAELQGVLQQLDEAKARGDLSPERYQNARNRVLAEMGKK